MNFSDIIKPNSPETVQKPDPLSDWPRYYYEERDPSTRLNMLNQAIAEGISPEEDKYRSMLFNLRYEPNQYGYNGYADNYMRCFMNFNTLSKNPPGRFGMSRARKNVLKDLKNMGIGAAVENEELYNSILLDEFCHAGQLYIALSAEDRNYCAVLFGFGKIKDSALIRKLYKDMVLASSEAADILDLRSEMDLWIHGLDIAREKMLPETTSFY